MDQQGLIDFPGLKDFKSFEYTLSQGISPGKATIEMPLEMVADIEQFGDLTISYGDVEITLPNCCVDLAHVDTSLGGNIARVTILDRRWLWRFGYISGHYNVRMPSGANADEGFNNNSSSSSGNSGDAADNIRPGTEQSPQDLATLCLEAMGESDFDVSQLPDDSRPEIDWTWHNPAAALQELCEKLGCRVVYDLDQDSVVLWSIGQGNDLPDNGIAMFPSITINPPETPSLIKLVGGPTMFQGVVPLEAVGIELDGSIVPIDDLSYTPDDGWESESPTTWGSFVYPTGTTNGQAKDPRILKLVEKCIYRMWRLTLPIDVPGTDENGDPIEVTDIRQIKLFDRLLDTHVDQNDQGQNIPKKPLLYGNFTSRHAQSKKSPPPNPDDPNAYYDGITVDPDRWLVITPEPLYSHDANGFSPCTLWLKIAYSVRDADTWEPIRYTRDLNLDNQADTPPQIIRHEEIFKKIVGNFSGTTLNGSRDNIAADKLDDQADHYLNAAKDTYIEQDALDMTYAGIVDIQIDGLIQQVTHSIQAGPGGKATTRASLAQEHNPYVLPWSARRRKERDDQRRDLITDLSYMRGDPSFRSGGF